MKTHALVVPFLRIAAATFIAVSWVFLAPRYSATVYLMHGALGVVNAFLIVPKGARRWLFVGIYYAVAGIIYWSRHLGP